VRRIFYLSAAAVAAFALAASSAPAADVPSTDISITPSPFAPGCGGAAEGSNPGANFNYPNFRGGAVARR